MAPLRPEGPYPEYGQMQWKPENVVETVTCLRKERKYSVLHYIVRLIVLLALFSYGIIICKGINVGEVIPAILDRILIRP